VHNNQTLITATRKGRQMNKQGGAREGAGRKSADGMAGPFTRTTVNLEASQPEKLAALGGSAFLRKIINKEFAKWQSKQ
jgi:hypothetical protein